MQILRKLAWIETKLFLREPVTLVLTFAFPLFVLFVLANVFGDEVDPEEPEVWRGVTPVEYYVPAYVGLVIAAIGLLSLPVHLAAYRERGVLRRFRASDVPLWAIFGAHLAVTLLMATIGAIAIIVAAMITYDTPLPRDIAPTLAAFLLSVLLFTGIGLLLGGVLPTARAAQAAGLLLFFLMFMVSGAGPPREVLGEGLRQFGNALPLTHSILLLQDPWLGFGWHTGASAAVAGMTVAASAAAWFTFRWE
jgi:ABC-2 type transport system permease protein